MAKKFVKCTGLNNIFNETLDGKTLDITSIKIDVQSKVNENSIVFLIANSADEKYGYPNGNKYIWTQNILYSCNDIQIGVDSSNYLSIISENGVNILDISVGSLDNYEAGGLATVEDVYNVIKDNEEVIASAIAKINKDVNSVKSQVVIINTDINTINSSIQNISTQLFDSSIILSKGITTNLINGVQTDSSLPTSKAVVEYVNNKLAGGVTFKGEFIPNTSTTGDGSTFYQLEEKTGDMYVARAAGKFLDTSMEIGDAIIFKTDINANTYVASGQVSFVEATTDIIGYNPTLNFGQTSKIATIDGHDLNVTMPGTIKRTYSATDTPFIQIGAGNYDVSILRVASSANTMSADHGFTLQYAGTGSDVNNRLRLYADNQSGSQVTAISINQAGQVGVGVDSDTSYRVKVDGKVSLGNELILNDANGGNVILSFIRGTASDTTYDYRIRSSSGILYTELNKDGSTWKDMYHISESAITSNISIQPASSTLLLGSSSARWKNIYSNEGNFSGNVSTNGYFYQKNGNRVTDVSETVTELGTSGNYLTWTKNNSTTTISVPYAGVSGSINDRALVTTSSGPSGANKWAKFGTLSFNHTAWEQIQEEYLIRGTETNFFSGILHITGRSGSSATTFDQLFLNWVALSNPDYENTVVAIKTGNNIYDLYIKSIKNYTQFRYNVLNSSGKIEFITSGWTWIDESALPTPSGANSVIYSYLKSSAETIKQYNTSDNYNYRILLSGGDNDTTKSDTVNKSSSLLFNPSSNILTVDSISTNQYNYKALKFATLGGYESTGWYKIGRFNKEIAGDSAIISIKLSRSNWAESYVFCISCTSPAQSSNQSAQINITQLSGQTGGWHKLQKIAIYKNNPEQSGTEFELWMYVNYGTSTSSGGILSSNDYYIGVSNNFSSFTPITSISKDESKTDSSFQQVLNTYQGIATTGQITAKSNLYSGTHLPNSANTYNLGSNSNKWNYVYADKYVLKTDSTWADTYRSIPFGVNGEPQSISYYKDTFNFNPGTDTLKSTNYLVKGGNIKVETNSSTAGCTMIYDSTEECMKFAFS